jgi:chaperonin cofactor prefoldin
MKNENKENEQFNKLDRRILMLEEQIKNIDEKLDMLTDKIDTGFSDIGKTYVRKDTYSKDLKAIAKQDKMHSEDIEKIGSAVTKLVWLLASTIVGFIIMQILGNR